MAERRSARLPLKVVHRHRIGAHVFKRVSELVFVRGEPKAILRWIDSAGIRTPLYADLDPAKLRPLRRGRHIAFYDGTTSDPSELAPKEPAYGRRRHDGQPRPGGRRRTDPPAERRPAR